MKQYAPILLIFALISAPSYAKYNNNDSAIYLVGGGLKTCSSMSKKNCTSTKKEQISKLAGVKFNNLYAINNLNIQQIDRVWTDQFGPSNKYALIKLLRKSSELINNKVPLSELKRILKNNDHDDLIYKMSDPEYYALLDLLEQPVINEETGERLKEYVALLDSTNYFSTNIYQQFVAQAKAKLGHNKPNIVVLTASARDPFEAADFYQSAFEQAGANAIWLPLDATLNKLMSTKGNRDSICKDINQVRSDIQGSFNREYVYPDLAQKQFQACLNPDAIISTIQDADGLFINGGDQSLTLQAFINADGSDSQILHIIKQKLQTEHFVIGGTSAGTAVMSGDDKTMKVPMITNGQSNTALVRGAKKDVLPVAGCHKSASCKKGVHPDDLTYRAKGGLGLFHWGVLDTHFSERGRQGRLAQLLIDTNTKYGLGVDEATALVVTNVNKQKATFNVIGQGGVFIIENSGMNNQTNSVFTHYISYGDTVEVNGSQLDITLADWKSIAAKNELPAQNIDKIFDRSRYKSTAELLCRTNSKRVNANDKWDNNLINIEISKTENSVNGYGAIKVEGNITEYCSYKSYKLSFNTEIK
ncbi:cyanophycinase [Psychrosphaera aquimarina]|uniref:Cyanophycinase n=1 Tax=Psychrosphaera aquimarina TaxID=2044854 RepID=A0ABU3QX53_9GAMM|nr:cyanophycinase [Psychrosphaera aquimarina]MDU0112016.1 cyanophycinase [Psychrosphaera aquimarina]